MQTENTEYSKAIEYLSRIENQLARQNSLRRMFLIGIVYGVGFFVGSGILATIAFGVIGPYIARIHWVHDAYISGNALQGR